MLLWTAKNPVEISSSVGDTHWLKQGMSPFTRLMYLLNLPRSCSGSFDRSLEGTDALCLNITTAESRRLFPLPWFRPLKGQMQDFVGVWMGSIALVRFFLLFTLQQMWRISSVRKDSRNFGSALVQMSASLLKMLPIASLKDKKQCPIHFGDTLDENKKEKKKKENKAFAGTEWFYHQAKCFLKASGTVSLILL